MNRRTLLQGAAAFSLLSGIGRGAAQPMPDAAPTRRPALSRVRPGDPGWPDQTSWDHLDRQVGGRLVKVQSPLAACRDAPDGAACLDVFKELKNPYYIGDDVALTQTCGWVDAWTAEPSVYAVAAETTADVVAAVNFARLNNLRLVVKGGGHSYLGTSNAPDSLMIWTRRMHEMTVHDRFVAQGCGGRTPPQPAVTVEAGAIWMHLYNEVTTKHGRYVQGGGCGTVGVAGLVQGGGFGGYSKQFGTAAASLIEAEIVTADGEARIANACTNPDLFWALKGGGGGTFGVVTRLTLRTHDAPARIGAVNATIRANSDAAFRRLISAFVTLCADHLITPAWGDIVTLRPGHRLDIRLAFQGIEQSQAEAVWDPFFRQIAAAPADFAFAFPPRIASAPGRDRWDPEFFRIYAPGAIRADDRPDAPADNIFWAANLSEAGHFLYGFESLWLPVGLLRGASGDRLADALVAAAGLWSVELHLQKGMAGAPADTLAAVKDTPINPRVLDAFALAIIAGEGPPAVPGLRGHEPDLAAARRSAGTIATAAAILKTLAPDSGSYVAESSFFEKAWQSSYWGPNYSRLLAVKNRYDPTGLFYVRHGVGSEGWSADGFTRTNPL
jgi:FAD/FMN-containing dehydrogenase